MTWQLVEIPYDLETVDFDAHPNDPTDPWLQQLRWLMMTTHDGIEDMEVGRVFLAAGLLKQQHPNTPIADCLKQAIIWERG